MDNLLIFAIKNIIFTSFLYLLWRFTVGTKGLLKFSRFYLLSITIFSIPICLWQKTPSTFGTIYLPEIIASATNNLAFEATQGVTPNILTYTYWTIVLILLGSIVAKILYLLQLKKFCVCTEKNSLYKIYSCSKIPYPISFYKWIFLPTNINEKAKQLIVKHEVAHIKQKHTIDLIFLNIAGAILWFNPFVVLIRQDIKLIHEVLADRMAVNKANLEFYLKLLTGLLYPEKVAICSTFYTKQIQKRIAMITQKTNKSNLVAYAITLIALIFATAFPAFAQQDTSQTQQATDQNNVIVDKLPEFPGGESGLRKFIAEHLNYPTLAQEQEIQGTVIVQFIIDENGKVKDPKIVKSVHPLLDKEVLRVVSLLPDFKPAEYKGKPVSFNMTLPIVFKLDVVEKSQ